MTPIRKFYAVATIFSMAAIAVGYDSYAETRILIVDDCEIGVPDFKVTLASLNVEYSAIETEILNPKFTSNFNRLVVFPELGSRGVLKGHRLTIRGPPKVC